jgi:flagellar biogenesis protein FliO
MTRLLALALALGSSTALAQPPPSMHPITTLSAPAPAAAPTPAAAAAIAPAPAAPAPVAPVHPPSFEIVDRGDTVEVIAHGFKAARTAIVPFRSRLDIPVVAGPTAQRLLTSDPTVKLVELDTEDATRMLSVKLGFEHADVKTLARFAQALQVGDDLHVLVPRKVPTGPAPKLPDPTVPPALAAGDAKTAPRIEVPSAPKTETILAAKPSTEAKGERPAPRDTNSGPALDAAAAATAHAAKLVGDDPRSTTDAVAGLARPDTAAIIAAHSDVARADAPRTDLARAAAKPSSDGKSLRQTLSPEGDDAWSKIAMYGALGLATAGAGIWLMRRRRAQVVPPATIEVIAQRSLGGKARIIWLSVGPREMIVSVTAQQVRMLGQWRKTDTAAALPAALPAAHAHLDARVEPRIEPGADRGAIAEKPLSPAVSGILRLRGRTGQIPVAVPEEVASDDVVADELWAKEILAATGARR